MLRALAAAGLLLLFRGTSWSAPAQVVPSGEIRGMITSALRAPLQGVSVSVTAAGSQPERCSLLTDQHGCFHFPGLPPATYTLEAQKSGFVTQIRENLRVEAGDNLELLVILSPGSSPNDSEGSAAAEVLDFNQQDLYITRMEQEFLRYIPSARSLAGQLDIVPWFRSGSAFGAAQDTAQSFRLEGIRLDDSETGALAVFPDYDAIQHITLIGPGAPAHAGGFSGAAVEIVTKSGGNAFQGQLNLFLQLPDWHSRSSSDPFVSHTRFEETYGIHFNLGGAVAQDRLWFFTAGRLGSWKEYIDDLPEEYSEFGSRWGLLAKLSWRPANNHRVLGWLETSRDTLENIEAGPFSEPEAIPSRLQNQWVFSLNWSGGLSASTSLDVKFGGFVQRGGLELVSEGPPHFDLGSGVLSGNYWEYREFPQSRYSLRALLDQHTNALGWGSHAFKLGVELEAAPLRDRSGFPGGELYLDYFGEPQLKFVWGGYDRRAETWEFNAFVQDSWSVVNDRVILNLGLRLTHARGYLSDFGEAAFSPRTGLAPRLGMTWDISGDQRTFLTVHYGRYYHGVKASAYTYLEHEGVYQEYFWDSGTWVLYFEDPWEATVVDPALRLPYMKQAGFSLERAFGRDVRLKLSYVSRSHHDFIDRVNLSGDWQQTGFQDEVTGETFPAYHRVNPGDNSFLQTNPSAEVDYSQEWGAAFPGIVSFTPTRRYRGWVLTLDKRFSHGWQLFLSYVYSRARGTDDNAWAEFGGARTSAPGSSLLFVNPNYQINADGRLTIDPTHLLKASGSVQIPKVDVVLGFFYSWASGETYNRLIWIPDSIDPDPVSEYSQYVYILGEERGRFRYPSQHNLDVRLEKFFQLPSGYRLGFLVDVFNAFNAGTTTQVNTRIDPWTEFPFGKVSGVRFPRTFRTGIRFSF
jgi:hypothetical protein